MKVKFLPQGITVEIKSGQSVMDVAKKNKLSISSSCNGMCSCAECRVYIVEGESHLLSPSVKEEALIGEGHFIDNRRLSCQLFCFGDIVVDLSEQVDRAKQEGGVNKQFLKQITKTTMADSFSIGGMLVEDKEINNIKIPELKTKNNIKSTKQNSQSNRKKFYRYKNKNKKDF